MAPVALVPEGIETGLPAGLGNGCLLLRQIYHPFQPLRGARLMFTRDGPRHFRSSAFVVRGVSSIAGLDGRLPGVLHSAH